MKIALITGSAGLIGSEAVNFLKDKFDLVVGIDNNMREYFFGPEGSVLWNQKRLEQIPNYKHYNIDIRDFKEIEKIFQEFNKDISLIIHAAAQPSHDWAAKEPLTDFTVNALGTLNLLEATRKYAPEAVFIFTSTNKVYGDQPNSLPLVELEERYEIEDSHPYHDGIDETMSIDQTMHSVFGASKVAADVTVQEYGKYFGLKTGVFRGGCLTGSKHSGAKLHGFLGYLIKCALTHEIYGILGYKGKQVRDNIHSYDLINMFWYFYQNPRGGEVYNAGGGRYANCSILEAIRMIEEITGVKVNYEYVPEPRRGDHIWWISSVKKFKEHYPGWNYKYSLKNTIQEIAGGLEERLKSSVRQ